MPGERVAASCSQWSTVQAVPSGRTGLRRAAASRRRDSPRPVLGDVAIVHPHGIDCVEVDVASGGGHSEKPPFVRAVVRLEGSHDLAVGGLPMDDSMDRLGGARRPDRSHSAGARTVATGDRRSTVRRAAHEQSQSLSKAELLLGNQRLFENLLWRALARRGVS